MFQIEMSINKPKLNEPPTNISSMSKMQAVRKVHSEAKKKGRLDERC